jgi:succinate dehydrogenase / fumarate reductase membrane anchor subunit
MRQPGIGSGGAFEWFFQRITGVVLFVTLLLHFLFLHYLNAGQVDAQGVWDRLQHPFWKTVDLLFLVTAIYHGAQGVIMNIHDYVYKPFWRLVFVSLVWVIGLTFLLAGGMTIINFELTPDNLRAITTLGH